MIDFIRDGKSIYFNLLKLVHNDKKLIIVPLISTTLCLAIFLFITHPLVNFETAKLKQHQLNLFAMVVLYAALFIFLFIRNILSGLSSHYTLINLNNKLNGQWSHRNSVKQFKRITVKSIFWVFFISFTAIWLRLIDLILSFDSKRRLFGGSQFHFATSLSGPIISFDSLPLKQTIPEGGKLITRTWGKPRLKLGFSFHFYTLIIFILCSAPVVVALAFTATPTQIVWISFGVSAILFSIFNSYHHVMCQHINLCLYRYAKHGQVTEPFTEETLKYALQKALDDTTAKPA